MFYGQTSPNLTLILVVNHRRRVLRAKEEGDLPACHQRSVQKPASLMVWGCIIAYGMSSLHVLEGTMNAERYIKVLVCSPPDYVYFREGLVYFSRTMQNHILQLLQQHGFVVKSPGAELACLQKYVKDDHELFSSWKPISGKNGTKFHHQNSGKKKS